MRHLPRKLGTSIYEEDPTNGHNFLAQRGIHVVYVLRDDVVKWMSALHICVFATTTLNYWYRYGVDATACFIIILGILFWCLASDLSKLLKLI